MAVSVSDAIAALKAAASSPREQALVKEVQAAFGGNQEDDSGSKPAPFSKGGMSPGMKAAGKGTPPNFAKNAKGASAARFGAK